MPVFILIVLVLLFASHFGVYYFFVTVFSIQKGKVLFGIIMGFLSISFFISKTIGLFTNNLFARIFEYMNSVWLGTLLGLLIFIFISCIIILILNFFKVNFDIKYLGIFTIIGALIYTGYGIWNANNLKIQDRVIEIANIPNEWKNKKVLFFADSHFGNIRKEKFFQKIIDMINKENADLVFISGDLFDGKGPDFSYFKEYANKINVKDGIYLVEGNHDFYFGALDFEEMMKGTNIKLLKNQFEIIDGVQIVGLDYAGNSNYNEVLSALNQIKEAGYKEEVPSILLFHEPIFTTDFKNTGIDLQLSGHTHAGQIWPLGYITKAIYKGMDNGLVVQDNFQIYTTSGIGTWGPPMRVGNSPELVRIIFK